MRHQGLAAVLRSRSFLETLRQGSASRAHRRTSAGTSGAVPLSPVVAPDREHGSAVAEFVMVAALLLFVAMGVFQLGLALYVRNTLISAASEGARYGARADAQPGDGVGRTASPHHLGLERVVRPGRPGRALGDGIGGAGRRGARHRAAARDRSDRSRQARSPCRVGPSARSRSCPEPARDRPPGSRRSRSALAARTARAAQVGQVAGRRPPRATGPVGHVTRAGRSSSSSSSASCC